MTSDPFDLSLSLNDSSAFFGVSAMAEPNPFPADDTDAAEDSAPDERQAQAPETTVGGRNYYLTGDRGLARGWPARARDNISAILLSKELEASGRTPSADEQATLLRFIGFGATELAQNCFRRPGEEAFRPGWEDIAATLEAAVTPAEYAALQRATQYAHYTPEIIIRALWQTAERLGFTGGRVLEPGMGTGLFFALQPEPLRDSCQLTGAEYDPVTARIARLVHPEARVRCEDFTRSPLGGGFDLAIGNPPYADRVVRADPATRALGLRLHDYFIARSIDRLRPGGIALFVTSTGTMDKIDTTAREHIASMADLVGAVRLPEGSFRASAGTDVVVDLLVFQRRLDDATPAGAAWIALAPAAQAEADDDGTEAGPIPDVNRYFVDHPEMVLGEHAIRRGVYGPDPTYTCRPRPNSADLETLLREVLERLPAGIVTPPAETSAALDQDDATSVDVGTAADGALIKEGSYFLDKDRLMQVIDGAPRRVVTKTSRSGDGIASRDAKIIRGLLPIRDAIRSVLHAQVAGCPWDDAQLS